MLCLRYFLIERLLTPNRSRSFGDSGSFMLLAPGYEGANAEEIEECPEHGQKWDGEDNAEETHDLPPAMMARKIRIEGIRRVCPCIRGGRRCPLAAGPGGTRGPLAALWWVVRRPNPNRYRESEKAKASQKSRTSVR